jgi:hypothetical protein
MIREFILPALLALASTIPGVLGLYASDYARRWLWTATIFLWCLAAVTFIWSDPVRGPFYKATHSKTSDTFKVHGVVTLRFTLKELSRGIDVTERGIKIGNNDPPVQIWVRNNWLFGWKYKISLNVDGQVYDVLDGDDIGRLPPGWDLNHDESAIEIVNPDRMPTLQIITGSDYDMYLNLAIISNPNTLIVNNTTPQGGRISQKPTRLLRREDLFPLLFQYPSYAHRGQRA